MRKSSLKLEKIRPPCPCAEPTQIRWKVRPCSCRVTTVLSQGHFSSSHRISAAFNLQSKREPAGSCLARQQDCLDQNETKHLGPSVSMGPHDIRFAPLHVNQAVSGHLATAIS